MGNTLQNKVIQFHEKIVFDFLKEIRNYLVANPIIRNFSFSKNLSLYPTSQPHSTFFSQRAVIPYRNIHLQIALAKLFLLPPPLVNSSQSKDNLPLANHAGSFVSKKGKRKRKRKKKRATPVSIGDNAAASLYERLLVYR